MITALPAISTQGMTSNDVDKLIEQTREVMIKTFHETSKQVAASHQVTQWDVLRNISHLVFSFYKLFEPIICFKYIFWWLSQWLHQHCIRWSIFFHFVRNMNQYFLYTYLIYIYIYRKTILGWYLFSKIVRAIVIIVM